MRLYRATTRRFSEVSISQIVKNAGIPTGSFYSINVYFAYVVVK